MLNRYVWLYLGPERHSHCAVSRDASRVFVLNENFNIIKNAKASYKVYSSRLRILVGDLHLCKLCFFVVSTHRVTVCFQGSSITLDGLFTNKSKEVNAALFVISAQTKYFVSVVSVKFTYHKLA